jgi:hypothetical protein
MPAQANKRPDKVAEKKSYLSGKPTKNSSKEFELFHIALCLRKAGLAEAFILDVVKTALKFEGVSDLLHLWFDEKDDEEREKIVADIQDMIDACTQSEKSEETYIKFNDLDAIAKDFSLS